jgi:DNA-binding beta-propeller fold protein YncE
MIKNRQQFWCTSPKNKEEALKRIVLSFAALAVLGLCALAGAQTATWQTPATPAKMSAREFATLQLEEQIPVPNVAGRVIHSISGVAEPQGPLYVPEFDKLFVADAGDGKVNIFDGGTYTLRKSIDLGADPDNVRYDAASKKVFVGFGEEDGGIAMIDPASEERVGEVFKTGGHPESFQIEASGGHIYVNVPDQGNVVESIDRKTGAVTKWPLKGLKGNYAMALNEEDHRLFTVTRKAPMLVVLDTQTGKEVTRMRAAGECDDVYFDANRKRIYVIGAEGFISVIEQKDPNHYELLENVPSTIGVRTGYFFTKRDRFYVGVPAKGSEPAQIWTYEAED